ncbi:DUF4381 domain-containing protein [Thermomonas sp.]|uniref:DUF4381 domain-containing protein n=1 Tax=Thermomonas sp. TaxID=1971895 RepID=UPI0024878826|nr:DUF4381 domain-containing protein [Thermomonas sp.]MDI1251756.1 DUF4381 domain-containing protein [Thermomonas sp.]
MHPGITPSWWPPAPGWWLLAAIILIGVAVLVGWLLRKRRRQAALLRLFDEAVDRAETPSQQVAAMSELLRRAARRRDPAADRLEGEEWLCFLDDGLPGQPFSSGAGALLRDGGFRADVAEGDVAALRILARRRYLLWMQRR